MKFLDKPRLISWTDFSFRSKFIFPDSIRRNLSEASVSVVEMLNSFQWSPNRVTTVIPNAVLVDFISSKSSISD